MLRGLCRNPFRGNGRGLAIEFGAGSSASEAETTESSESELSSERSVSVESFREAAGLGGGVRDLAV